MNNKEMLQGLNYEGFYDDDNNFCININIENAGKLIQRITGAAEVTIYIGGQNVL